MGRKIPGRKHRGIKDPEKQAAVRFESIKNKINAPPMNPDSQEIPKSLQRVMDLKNKVKSGEFKKPKVRNKTKKKFENIDSYDKNIPTFNRRPGESDRDFVRRVNRICSDVVREAVFQEKYGVEIKRNDLGEIEGVVKRKKDELELLVKKIKKEKKIKEQKGSKNKKKLKEKLEQPHLSKWQKRKKKLDEKKNRKNIENFKDFDNYKDKVKFGEIAHAPPSLTAPRKVQNLSKIGHKNLLLNSLIKNDQEQHSKPTLSRNLVKDNVNKTSNKVIDKKGKRKDLPNSLRRQLEKQQMEIVTAYKNLKAQKYK